MWKHSAFAHTTLCMFLCSRSLTLNLEEESHYDETEDTELEHYESTLGADKEALGAGGRLVCLANVDVRLVSHAWRLLTSSNLA